MAKFATSTSGAKLIWCFKTQVLVVYYVNLIRKFYCRTGRRRIHLAVFTRIASLPLPVPMAVATVSACCKCLLQPYTSLTQRGPLQDARAVYALLQVEHCRSQKRHTRRATRALKRRDTWWLTQSYQEQIKEKTKRMRFTPFIKLAADDILCSAWGMCYLVAPRCTLHPKRTMRCRIRES